MGKSLKEYLDRYNNFLTAWETHREDKTFAGLTLPLFREAITASFSTRTEVSTHESELKAAISRRQIADDATDRIVEKVVKDVISQEGEDSDFHEALGCVRESERKSGLSRKAKATETTSKI